MNNNPPSPEPKGVPPMFGADSWQRPDAAAPGQPAKPAPRREWPAKVTAKSFREILGPKRLEEWGKACEDHGLDLAALMAAAGKDANDGTPCRRGHELELHKDARHYLRVRISDGIRDHLTAAGTPDAPRPVLY